MLKKLTLAALIVSISLSATADCYSGDPWTGPDKKQHTNDSAVLGYLASELIEDKLWAFSAAITPGILKEIHDCTGGNHEGSTKDILADLKGIGIGMGLNAIFHKAAVLVWPGGIRYMREWTL